MFKVNNKNARMMSMSRSGVFIVNFELISYLFSNVSIVQFEQTNIGCVFSQSLLTHF